MQELDEGRQAELDLAYGDIFRVTLVTNQEANIRDLADLFTGTAIANLTPNLYKWCHTGRGGPCPQRFDTQPQKHAESPRRRGHLR